MRVRNSLMVGVSLLVEFALGSIYHPARVQARTHMTAHIEQVFAVPMGRETNGSIAGFSCASGDGPQPQCFALVVSGN